jgi:hypothetical protein
MRGEPQFDCFGLHHTSAARSMHRGVHDALFGRLVAVDLLDDLAAMRSETDITSGR